MLVPPLSYWKVLPFDRVFCLFSHYLFGSVLLPPTSAPGTEHKIKSIKYVVYVLIVRCFNHIYINVLTNIYINGFRDSCSSPFPSASLLLMLM